MPAVKSSLKSCCQAQASTGSERPMEKADAKVGLFWRIVSSGKSWNWNDTGNGPTKEGKLLCTREMCLKPQLPKSFCLQEVIAKNLATLQKLETYDPRITVPCEDVIGRVQPCPQYEIVDDYIYFKYMCVSINAEKVMDHRGEWCSIQYWCFAPGLPFTINSQHIIL